MLDVRVEDLSLRVLRAVTVDFPRSTHTAIVGAPGCGVSSLLHAIAGLEPHAGGRVYAGTHDVTSLPAAKRPMLFAGGELDVPGRWSVEHALVNAVRGRSLDRIDRRHELMLAAEKWSLPLDRRVGSLADSERGRLHLARIELRKPGILIADKVLLHAPGAAGEWYRTLRVLGSTVISAPASTAELGHTDAVVVLENGRVLQRGSAAEVYGRPRSAAAAAATGIVSAVPVVITGDEVDSPIGAWRIGESPFQGSGIALVRPESFVPAAGGEESDFIFGIEEASFDGGRWLTRGLLSGGTVLHVALPAAERVFKGRVLALRYDASAFTLIPA